MLNDETKTEAAHTPGPFSVRARGYGYAVEDLLGSRVAGCTFKNEAQRIADCLNALEGLDPAGVRDFLHIVELRAIEIVEGHALASESFNAITARASAREILSALAKLRGDA